MATASVQRPRQPARSIQSSSSSIGIDRPSVKPVSKPVSLSKRLLFPQLPADADLPPLLASPAAQPALNAELYDFIALALRAYVNPWWTKITRYDKEFLPAITRVLTAVIRAFETRLVATDLSPLVYRDIPTLLTQHCVDFRNAKSKLHTSYASGGAATLPQLFHHLQPHMAISADGRIDDVYIRQAVDHVLKACLPPEDYDAEAERYIVREVVLGVLLRSVIPRVTQPWFIHKLILDNLGPENAKAKPPEPPDPSQLLASSTPDNAASTRTTYSLQSLAIFLLSAIQSISGSCLLLIHAYRQTRDTIKKVNQSTSKFSNSPHPDPMSSPSSTVSNPKVGGTRITSPPPRPLAVPGALVANTIPEPIVVPVPQHPPTPTSISSINPMSRTTSRSTVQSAAASTSSIPPSQPPALSSVAAIPNYTQPPLKLLITLLTPPPLPSSPSSSKVPPTTSFCTALALAHTLSLPLTFLESFISRLLPYLLYTHVLSAPRLAGIVRSARRALFPEGWPGPAPPDPTPEEQAAMRAELGRRLLASVPAPLAPLLGPTPEARLYTVDGMLDPLSSQACNAHLMLFLLDLFLLTIFPELGVSESAAAAVGPEAGADGATSKAS